MAISFVLNIIRAPLFTQLLAHAMQVMGFKAPLNGVVRRALMRTFAGQRG
jgi:hypothetical protein